MATHEHPTASAAQPPASVPVPTPVEPDVLRHGDVVGNYVIRSLLGEGGFARVYSADQKAPVKRRVAFKIIKPGMDSRQVLIRFEAERQALALMSHPHVARVFDAGCTDRGRPYFVLEHVPGVPITAHCETHHLDIESRLRLFVKVCRAVQHAHQKGIIHRDIKPSNILVTMNNDDGDGEAAPKVIDFGVAKALHSPLTDQTLHTEHGQMIGTPEYMSPEQAEVTAQDIDTRSDIYGLGVLLYEMLTGMLPFDQARLRGVPHADVQRIIREEEPARPSTRLGNVTDADLSGIAPRSGDRRAWSRRLRGDLDWIVMTALEKDRERRYQNASDFAADIERHLANEPVLAGPPGLWYRAGKFVRRRRRGLFQLAIAMLVIVAGSSIGAWMLAQRVLLVPARVTVRADQRSAALRTSTGIQLFAWTLPGNDGTLHAVNVDAADGGMCVAVAHSEHASTAYGLALFDAIEPDAPLWQVRTIQLPPILDVAVDGNRAWGVSWLASADVFADHAGDEIIACHTTGGVDHACVRVYGELGVVLFEAWCAGRMTSGHWSPQSRMIVGVGDSRVFAIRPVQGKLVRDRIWDGVGVRVE